MIAEDDELELRRELKAVLMHEAGADRVAARDPLHLTFGPTPPAVSLARGHHAGAGQASKFLCVPILR